MKTFKHIKNFLAAIGSALVGCTERGEILPEPAECLFCHVPEGDGVCCDCLEIQRQQGRYDELWA